jgi:peptidoglycan hydrolase-like protein with peptidoglycan-binding domain
MNDIKDSVGDGENNDVHDVALIQAMLVVVKNVKGAPYLNNYDGVFGKNTKNAIIAFQKDNIFLPQGGWMDAGAGMAKAVPDATPGSIGPKDATFKKLAAMLPDKYKEIRVIENTTTVYLPAPEHAMKASRQEVSANAELEVNFRGNVGTLIEEMWYQHGIALSVTPQWADGWRRTFQAQYKLMFKLDENGKLVTKAGPGESNHNFGQAVDIGFKGLRWLKGNGEIVEDEDWWLHKLAHKKSAGGEAKSAALWKVMREVASTEAGLFRGPVSDMPHLQAWDDNHVIMPRRLAALLTEVGTMKWTRAASAYKTDFGLGGPFFNVGTAKQIWEGNAPVSEQDLRCAQVGKQPFLEPLPD